WSNGRSNSSSNFHRARSDSFQRRFFGRAYIWTNWGNSFTQSLRTLLFVLIKLAKLLAPYDLRGGISSVGELYRWVSADSYSPRTAMRANDHEPGFAATGRSANPKSLQYGVPDVQSSCAINADVLD